MSLRNQISLLVCDSPTHIHTPDCAWFQSCFILLLPDIRDLRTLYTWPTLFLSYCTEIGLVLWFRQTLHWKEKTINTPLISSPEKYCAEQFINPNPPREAGNPLVISREGLPGIGNSSPTHKAHQYDGSLGGGKASQLATFQNILSGDQGLF